VTSVWSYDLAHNTAHSLAAQADATDAQAGVTRLSWLPDAHHPAVTWAASGTNGAIEGIYVASAYGDSLRQLTPSGARSSAAAYTGANGGQWLLGDGDTLALLALSADGPTTVAQLDAPATRIVWSPAGASAAVAHGGALSVWSAPGLMQVDTGVVTITPVWSASGESLLYATDGGVRLARVTGGHVAITPVLQAMGVNAVSWAPDGHGLAVVTSAGVVLIAPDGTHAKLVDRHAPDGAALVWSVAG
jgi:hypothetical protein